MKPSKQKKQEATKSIITEKLHLVSIDNAENRAKLDKSKAQEVPFEEIKNEEKLQEKESKSIIAENTTDFEQKKQTQNKISLEELSEVVPTLFYLHEKRNEIATKRANLNHFAIAHDDNNATVIVRDANGMEFKSSSPKTIEKLIEFWKEEFDNAKTAVDKKLQSLFIDTSVQA